MNKYIRIYNIYHINCASSDLSNPDLSTKFDSSTIFFFGNENVTNQVEDFRKQNAQFLISFFVDKNKDPVFGLDFNRPAGLLFKVCGLKTP